MKLPYFKNAPTALLVGKHTLATLSFLFLVLFMHSCKKDEPAKQPDSNGMAPGECRITRMDDTAIVSYTGDNKISKIASYVYSYEANKVTLTDNTVYKEKYIFNLNAKGYPISMGYRELTDTNDQELTWFVYNADSTLNLSRSYVWVKDHFEFTGKTVYTWTKKNLTRIVNYGKDSVNAYLVVNIAYDPVKLDKRKSNFEKMFTFSPVYAIDFLPKCASVNLATDLQYSPTGQASEYYKISQTLDAKSNVSTEYIKTLAGAEIYHQNFKYECN